MSVLRTNICWKSFRPLVSGHVDNVLMKIAPILNQPLFHFIYAVDVYMVNTFHRTVVHFDSQLRNSLASSYTAV